MEIVIISSLIAFFGFLVGIYIAMMFKKRGRHIRILPGQAWYIPGAGVVQIAHVLKPDADVVYIFKCLDEEAHMSGVCSSKVLKRTGMLMSLDEEDEEIYAPSDYPAPDLKVIEFPQKDTDESEE